MAGARWSGRASSLQSLQERLSSRHFVCRSMEWSIGLEWSWKLELEYWNWSMEWRIGEEKGDVMLIRRNDMIWLVVEVECGVSNLEITWLTMRPSVE